jgi:hypothetical protein
MNLLILDVDGVLNNNRSEQDFEPRIMNILRHIVESSNAKIVISSDRRRSGPNLARLRAELVFYGMNFIGTTPILNGEKRKREIAAYLRENPGWEKVVILDDLESAGLYKPNKILFIRTDQKLGLTEEDADKAVNFFRKE